MTKKQLVACLEQTAMLADRLSIGMNPRHRTAQDFLNHPQPGDLVLEVTTVGDRVHDGRRLGWLISHGREPLHTDEEWAAAIEAGDWDKDAERPTQETWSIRAPDGLIIRWHNARFIRVPVNYHEKMWAVEGKDAFKTAHRCPDCGADSRLPMDATWTQFDEATGACRICKGLVDREDI